MKLDITQTDTIDMSSLVDDTTIDAKSTDGVSGEQKETRWTNPHFTEYNGYYENDTVPEFSTALNHFATWVLGRGYTTENVRDEVILEHITGWGEDSFNSILWNMHVVKKFNGDSYSEIIRMKDFNKKDLLLNLKPLDPASITHVLNSKGRIIYYEQTTKTKEGEKKVKPHRIDVENMLHFCNDRTADNHHGQSYAKRMKWTLLALKEALSDKRRLMHLSTIRVIEVEEDDKSRLTQLKADYKEGIETGNVLLVPKGTGKIQDLAPVSTEHLAYIAYLENKLYLGLGVPKIIMGGTDGATESGGKTSYLTFEQVYSREITELEIDIWNQLGIKITFNKPASLKEGMNDTAAKSNAQSGFQPSDTEVTQP